LLVPLLPLLLPLLPDEPQADARATPPTISATAPNRFTLCIRFISVVEFSSTRIMERCRSPAGYRVVLFW
jgi:hypothetical protein